MTKIHIPFAGLLGALALLASCTFYPAPQGSLSLGLTIPREQTSGSGRLILADAMDLELRVSRSSETVALLRVRDLQPEKKYEFTVQSLDLNFSYQVEAKVLGQGGTVLYSGAASVTPTVPGGSTPVNLILVPDAARRVSFSWTTGVTLTLDSGKSAAYNLTLPGIEAPRGFRITGLPAEGVAFYLQDASDGKKIDLGSSRTVTSLGINLPGGARNYILTLFNSTQATLEFPLYGGWVQDDDTVADKRPLSTAFTESQSALDVLLTQGTLTEASPGVPEFRSLLASAQGLLNDWTASQSALDGKVAELISALAALKGPSVIKVTGVSLEAATLDLAVGAFRTLTASVTPSGADNKNLTWASADPAVASVDAAGKVTALKVGTTTVTVTTEDGGFTASVIVKVYASTLELLPEDPVGNPEAVLEVRDAADQPVQPLSGEIFEMSYYPGYQVGLYPQDHLIFSGPAGGASYIWMLSGEALAEYGQELNLSAQAVWLAGNGTLLSGSNLGEYTLTLIVLYADGTSASKTVKIRLRVVAL